jgi:uncharacterized protein
METELNAKYSRLLENLRSLGSAAVAFSGGVDSSFLCYAAAAALGPRAIAVTVVSPFLARSDLDTAKALARQVGIEHLFAEEPAIEEEVAANPRNRCYFCKKTEFGAILAIAKARGIAAVLDGSNLDDLGDYRPGLKALAELGIRSPLREAALTKAEIRELSRGFGLPTWDKPAAACLASRIPYGEHIDTDKLRRVEQAENFLRSRGFRQFRVRSHDTIARIETAREERRRFFNEALLDEVSAALKSYGFLYVAFELEGYTTGSLNRALNRPPEGIRLA